MVTKLKRELRLFLRALYAWLVKLNIKRKAKKLSEMTVRFLSLSWYKNLNEKQQESFHYFMKRCLAFAVLMTGVICIAVACMNFKDIFHIFDKSEYEELRKAQDNGKTYGYFLPDWANYDLEWKNGNPIFAEKFAEYIETAYNSRQHIKPLSGESTDLFVNKFVTNGYRFFLIANPGEKDERMVFNSWDYYFNYYAAKVEPGKNISYGDLLITDYLEYRRKEEEVYDILDAQRPESFKEMGMIYDQRYTYRHKEKLSIRYEDKDEEVTLFVVISGFNIIDEQVGRKSLVWAAIGMVFSLFAVTMNARLSGSVVRKNEKSKVFNRKTITALLATYLVGGFVILAAIFFTWYVGSGYGSYDANRKENTTILLAVLYAVFTFITTTMISTGLSAAHENAQLLKKLKAELIANVSHDIKTPLTSIISYINLLEKEKTLSKDGKYYISILKNKSERLKNIVSDLFELSKSTSGNSELTIENLDLKTLLLQTLADMEDIITNSGLDIRQNLPAAGVCVNADGKKLYRVFQNIIDNAVKYALPGAPVFITLRMAGKKAIVEIQNTASYEMNFTEEDVLARYTRGNGLLQEDGIGLGLSIADTFVKECGGEFKVKIAGNQFKVIVEFKTV